ncbi:hypothetical protein K438DRAFT_1789231 [Mycena galopus ATCC 62051]|nr:hypothetical protein K438DRAFT_1789231 [Mycena galopus ATCC 62051]
MSSEVTYSGGVFRGNDLGLDKKIAHRLSPENLNGLIFSPDLPGQLADDVGPSLEEGPLLDSTVGLGWHGTWATALLEKQEKRQSLGERNEIGWNSRKDLIGRVPTTWKSVSNNTGLTGLRKTVKFKEADADMHEDAETPLRGPCHHFAGLRQERVFQEELEGSDERNEDEDENMGSEDSENEDENENEDMGSEDEYENDEMDSE